MTVAELRKLLEPYAEDTLVILEIGDDFDDFTFPNLEHVYEIEDEFGNSSMSTVVLHSDLPDRWAIKEY